MYVLVGHKIYINLRFDYIRQIKILWLNKTSWLYNYNLVFIS